MYGSKEIIFCLPLRAVHLERLCLKKHTIGYYVWDEPHNPEQLSEARRQMDMLQKADEDAFTVSYELED